MYRHKVPKKKGSDVLLARGRLKGVLQDLVGGTDDELCEEPERTYHIPARGRPPKRIKKDPGNSSNVHVHQSYVMKLFDRSLDLAKYEETTPLYPICRAWMINQPRSSSIKNLRDQRTPSPEKREICADLLEKFNAGAIDKIMSLPARKEAICWRVPSPTPEQKAASKDKINLNYDLDAPSISRDKLMAESKQRWSKIRSKWMSNTKRYNERYSASFELLDAMQRE